MKIRKRITYTFTGLFGVLVLTLCLLVYFFSLGTQKQLFFNRLDERLKITEEFFLESDSFSEVVREKVRDNFLKTLPEEIEYVDTLNNFSAPENVTLPEDFISNLGQTKSLQWTDNKLQGMARVYQVNEVDFVVLVIATDQYGRAYLAKLRNILLLCFLISIIVTFFLSNFLKRNYSEKK